jgi:hypothetical protein
MSIASPVGWVILRKVGPYLSQVLLNILLFLVLWTAFALTWVRLLMLILLLMLLLLLDRWSVVIVLLVLHLSATVIGVSSRFSSQPWLRTG